MTLYDPTPPHLAETRVASAQIFVPVTAHGCSVLDNGGDIIVRCLNPAMADRIAALINIDAGFSRAP